MSTGEIIFAVLAAVLGFGSLTVAIITISHTKNKDYKKDAVDYGIILSEVGYIKSGVDDLKKNQGRHDEKLDILSERVAKMEAITEAHVNNKSLHSRATKASVKE